MQSGVQSSSEEMSTQPLMFLYNKPLNNQLLPQIPLDVLRIIIRKLDVKSLKKLMESNSAFAKLALENPCWKNLISQYFPYLVESKTDEYNKDSKSLFINHYTYFRYLYYKRDREWREYGAPLVLASIEGNFGYIEENLLGLTDELNEKSIEFIREILYLIAAVHGRIDPTDKRLVRNARAFTEACMQGNIPVVKRFLTAGKLDKGDIQSGSRVAADNGHVALVSEFFNHPSIGDIDKEDALKLLAKKGKKLVQPA